VRNKPHLVSAVVVDATMHKKVPNPKPGYCYMVGKNNLCEHEDEHHVVLWSHAIIDSGTNLRILQEIPVGSIIFYFGKVDDFDHKIAWKDHFGYVDANTIEFFEP
jgi:hypothetical protein